MEIEQQEFNQEQKFKFSLSLEEPVSFKRYSCTIKSLTDKMMNYFAKKETYYPKELSEKDKHIMKETGQSSLFYDDAMKNLDKHLAFQARTFPLSSLNWKNNYFEIEYPSYLKPKEKNEAVEKMSHDENLDVSYFLNKFNFLIKSEAETIVTIQGKDLKGGDLNRLRPRVWLNGELINFYTTLLSSDEFQQSIQRYYKNYIPNTDFIIMNTYFSMTMHTLDEPMKRFLDVLNNSENDAKLEAIIHDSTVQMARNFIGRLNYLFKKRKYDITKHNFMFIPDHVRNSHWKLYVVKGFKRCYDEMANLIRENPEAFIMRNFEIDKINEVLSISCIDSYYALTADLAIYQYVWRYAFNFLLIGSLNADFNISIPLNKILITVDNFYYYDMRVPAQNNNYDCGLAVIENIEQGIIHGESFIDEIEPNKSNWYDFDGITWKRERFISMIINLSRKQSLWVS